MIRQLSVVIFFPELKLENYRKKTIQKNSTYLQFYEVCGEVSVLHQRSGVAQPDEKIRS